MIPVIFILITALACFEWLFITHLISKLKEEMDKGQMYKRVADDLHETTRSILDAGLAQLDGSKYKGTFVAPNMAPDVAKLLTILLDIEDRSTIKTAEDYLTFIGNGPAGNALILSAQIMASKVLIDPKGELDERLCSILAANRFPVSRGPVLGNPMILIHTSKGPILIGRGI